MSWLQPYFWDKDILLHTFQDVELDNVPGESPYIGKARYKRNMFIREGYIANKAQQMEAGKMQLDEDDFCKKPQLKLQLQTLDELLEDKEKKINLGKLLFLSNKN